MSTHQIFGGPATSNDLQVHVDYVDDNLLNLPVFTQLICVKAALTRYNERSNISAIPPLPVSIGHQLLEYGITEQQLLDHIMQHIISDAGSDLSANQSVFEMHKQMYPATQQDVGRFQTIMLHKLS